MPIRLSDPTVLLSLMAAAAAAALALALTAQYAFGMLPCELCMYQRWPLLAIVVIGAGAAILLRRQPESGLARGAALLCALIFLLDAGIAGFHVGVEQGWWTGSSECTAPDSTGASLAELRAQIMNAPVVRCDEVAFSLFGISMAGYNLLFCLAMAGFGLRGLVQRQSQAVTA